MAQATTRPMPGAATAPAWKATSVAWRTGPRRAPPLREHLGEQLRLTFADPQDRLVGAYLIAMLDPAGRVPAEDAAIAAAIGLPTERVASVRARMMLFEPTGVFARDLRECLAAQLREKNRFDPAMAALLDNLELLARRDMRALMQVCGVGRGRPCGDGRGAAPARPQAHRGMGCKPAAARDPGRAAPCTAGRHVAPGAEPGNGAAPPRQPDALRPREPPREARGAGLPLGEPLQRQLARQVLCSSGRRRS